jgi:hypothetical protein
VRSARADFARKQLSQLCQITARQPYLNYPAMICHDGMTLAPISWSREERQLNKEPFDAH